MRRNAVACWGAAVALSTFASLAQAGNDDAYFLSNEAALTGGAVVAVTEDAGSVWYNPAGIGGIERNLLSLTVTAATLQIREIDGALTTVNLEGQRSSQELSGTHGGVISPSAAGVVRLFGVPIGFGFFTTRYDVLSVTGGTAFDSAQAGNATEKITLDQIDIEYNVGFGSGFAPTERLRLGASLFAVYTGLDDAATLAAANDDPAGQVVATAQERDMSSRWGGRLVLGVQYDLPPIGTLGLCVRSPVLMLHEDPNVASFFSYSVGGTANDFARADFPPTRSPADVGLSAPTTVVLGFTHRFSRAYASIGAEYSTPLRSLEVERDGETDYLVDRRGVFNLRIGGVYSLTDTLGLGLGLFTDRSPQEKPDDFGEFQVDYYGVAAGLRFDNAVRLAPGARAPDIVFRTVVAARYALGVGETRGLVMNLQRLSPSSTGTPAEDGELIDVTFHELYAYLGTAVDY
jgi:long-subunit fatty acid transport protein